MFATFTQPDGNPTIVQASWVQHARATTPAEGSRGRSVLFLSGSQLFVKEGLNEVLSKLLVASGEGKKET